jgi:hypothetical protein
LFDGINPLNAAHQPTFAKARAFVEQCTMLLDSDGMLPASQLDLAHFVKLAPFMCIVGVIDGGQDFEIRLAGTRFAGDFLGYEPTGKRFSQVLGDGPFGQRSWHIMREVLRTRQAVLNQPGQTRLKSKEFMTIESVNYPLIDDAGNVVKIAGINDFKFEKQPATV